MAPDEGVYRPTPGRVRQIRRDGSVAAFAPDHLPVTAGVFADLILLPMIMGGLFGEDLAALRSEIGPHVSQSVAFFLAASRYEGDPIGPTRAAPNHETAGLQCYELKSLLDFPQFMRPSLRVWENRFSPHYAWGVGGSSLSD